MRRHFQKKAGRQTDRQTFFFQSDDARDLGLMTLFLSSSVFSSFCIFFHSRVLPQLSLPLCFFPFLSLPSVGASSSLSILFFLLKLSFLPSLFPYYYFPPSFFLFFSYPPFLLRETVSKSPGPVKHMVKFCIIQTS